MADKTKETLRLIVSLMAIATIIASVGVAYASTASEVAHNREIAEKADVKAQKATDMAKDTAESFAFFKGQVLANLENMSQAQDRQEAKTDRLLELMSNLERAD